MATSQAQRVARLCGVATALLPLMVGCGAGSAAAPAAGPAPAVDAERSLEMDGVVIQKEPDPLTNLSIYGAEELFHLAREMERTERHADARRVYLVLLQHFADGGFGHPARFNLGLLYEREKDFDAAAKQYLEIAGEEAPEAAYKEARRTWLDAHFRLAVCYGKLEFWWRAVAVFDYVLAEEWIDDFDRLEAMVGRGISIQESGDLDSAEVALSGVLRFFREAESRNRFNDRGMVAEAAFRLGDIAHERYKEVALEFPVDASP